MGELEVVSQHLKVLKNVISLSSTFMKSSYLT